jgi:hypothetical protein
MLPLLCLDAAEMLLLLLLMMMMMMATIRLLSDA